MCSVIFLAGINTLSIYQKQTSTNCDNFCDVDGLTNILDMQHYWMVPHEPVEICGKLWISQALQDMGLDIDMQLAFLPFIQSVTLDLCTVVLFGGTRS